MHRIFFVVLHQPKGEMDTATMPLISKNSKEGRPGFNIRDFMSYHGYRHVIGVNCCRTQWDDSCDVVQKALKDKICLDKTGRTVLWEELGGVRTEVGKKD